ncbi:MAG: hypothetical protein ACRDSG_15240 [Pseudonocardiaceae bacterium]
MFRPVMRVYLAAGYTIRWRRGDGVAYVFADREACDGDRVVGAIDMIPVSKAGWTDAVEVRAVAARWLREPARTAVPHQPG